MNTGGGVILDNTKDIVVPEDMELSCGGTSVATADDSDYRIGHIGNAIVLDPAYTIKLSSINSAFTGCNLLAGPGGDNRNPFSPAIYYPKADGDLSLRRAINEYSAFNPNPTSAYPTAGLASASTGITVSAENVAVRNVTVLGFGTCYKSFKDPESGNAGKRLIIDHLAGDCDTGLYVRDLPSATQFNGFEFRPFLTRGNGGSSTLVVPITGIAVDGTHYRATVDYTATASTFRLVDNDVVWVGATSDTGRQSAAGRWTISNVTPGPCGNCQNFLLNNSVSAPIGGIAGTVNNVVSNGVPPNAITGISPIATNFDRVSVGQTVSDSSHCVPAFTRVAAVWRAAGIVYLSAPATCAAGPDTFSFADTTPSWPSIDCDHHPEAGCATISSEMRFGDGVRVEKSAGVSAVNCNVFEHVVAFHMYTNANNARFANCETGESNGLPDNGIIGLLIDGDHVQGDDFADSCDIGWVNGTFGQHRPISVKVQSDCLDPDKLTNVTVGPNGQFDNGVVLELDAGAVSLVNGVGQTPANLFKADKTDLYYDATHSAGQFAASLSISNNSLPLTTLYLENSSAAASTTGCGNAFIAVTPWLCPPALAELTPGGRLTLSSTRAVMRVDVASASTLYYLPYLGQRAPIYDQETGSFGIFDIGPAGLALSLDSSSVNKQAANNLYDIFVETTHVPGTLELCAGPAWTSSTPGASTRGAGLVQISGVRVNSGSIKCQYGVGSAANIACPAYLCTYLGTIYATADGRTTQQFGPNQHANGNGNCLCLYNAYNRVPIVSESLDSNAAYNYASTGWRAMDPHSPTPTTGVLTDNSITVVDGLSEMSITAQLNDALKAIAGTSPNIARIGIVLNSIAAAPDYFGQNSSASSIAISAVLRSPPILGLWYAQAVEAASADVSSGPMPSFGGLYQQQLSVVLDD